MPEEEWALRGRGDGADLRCLLDAKDFELEPQRRGLD